MTFDPSPAQRSVPLRCPSHDGEAAQLRQRNFVELCLVTLGAGAVYLFASYLELYERFASWASHYEIFQADEIPISLLALSIGLALFAYRRWTESLRQLSSRIRAEESARQLATANQLMTRRLINLQEAERRRLAYELHDHFGQTCNAIRVEAICLRDKADTSDDVASSCKRIAASADELYVLVRGLLYELRPPALDSLGIVASLQSLCEGWEERSRIGCAFIPFGEFGALDESCSIALYRIVQESLNNVVKHAAASHVVVRLYSFVEKGRTWAALEIADDGVGCTTPLPPSGLGWLGMKERAAMLGGSLCISGGERGGIQVSCRVPQQPQPSPSDDG